MPGQMYCWGVISGAKWVEKITSCRPAAPISHHRSYRSAKTTRIARVIPDADATHTGPSRVRYGEMNIRQVRVVAATRSGVFPAASNSASAMMLTARKPY